MKKQNSILIVDDDLDIGVMLKMMLEYKGYSVSLAERAQQIRDIIQSTPIDLIIMDMLLSGVNGVDICKALKSDQDTAAIPVIMTSAHPYAKDTCLANGADDFLSKPFEMEHMLLLISRTLKKEKMPVSRKRDA